MIDIIIPFLFGLMVGAGGGVMIAALLVASRESEKIGAKGFTEGHDLIRRDDAIEAVYARIRQIGYENDPYVLSIRQAIRDVPPAQPIIHCESCKWLQCNMRPDGYLPKGVEEFECRHWCGPCDPVDFCSHAERRAE